MNSQALPQSFPVESVRARFPALSQVSRPPIYLDNPAGTLVPQPVIDAVAGAMATASSNLGGFFAGSKRADAIWLDAHRAVADLLGAASKGQDELKGRIDGALKTLIENGSLDKYSRKYFPFSISPENWKGVGQ